SASASSLRASSSARFRASTSARLRLSSARRSASASSLRASASARCRASTSARLRLSSARRSASASSLRASSSPRFLPLPSAFLAAPFSLGFQPSRLVLSSLSGFCLRHSPALFRRYPWLPQRLDDFLTQALDLLTGNGGLSIEMTQGAPIDILTLRDDRENGVIPPAGLALERGN